MSRYPEILENIQSIALKANRDPRSVELVVVSKNHPTSEILPIYQAGATHFGENRVTDALKKIEELPKDIDWHFIGTLQKNKVNKILGKFSLIHSVDSLDLAKKISLSSEALGIETSILIQVNTSGEESKHGLSPAMWEKEIPQLLALPSLNWQGLMTMAPLTEDLAMIRTCFANLRKFKDKLEKEYSLHLPHLSMGMSHDFPIAIEEGATLLRIGTAVFE